MKKKILSIALALSLVAIGVIGTLAYLTDDAGEMTNTFTVGKVSIKLDEGEVEAAELSEENPYVYTFKDQENTRTEEGQTYENLLPGDKVQKDPTITVEEGSADCWVFMEVTLDYDQAVIMAKAAGATAATTDQANTAAAVLGDFDASKWTIKAYKQDADANTITFVAGYNEILSEEDTAVLFTALTVPASLTNEQMAAIDGMEMVFFARAIQASGLATQAEAFEALYEGLGYTPAP